MARNSRALAVHAVMVHETGWLRLSFRCRFPAKNKLTLENTMGKSQTRANHTSNANQSEPSSTTFRLIPVMDWAKHHPWPPVGGLRHLIFNAKSNGFDAVVRRIGRRVLIDEVKFFAWVEQKGGH
jgi:hypothetical protein